MTLKSLSSAILVATALFCSPLPASDLLLPASSSSVDSDFVALASESKDHGADCTCGCAVFWTVGADAVFMQRARPDNLVLAQDAFIGTPFLDADGFGFDFQTGWDISLSREGCGGGIEARFMNVDGWNAGQAVSFAGPTPVLIPNAVPFGVLPGVTSINATYNSELLSAELNLRRDVADQITLLGGFRYLELDEHYHADFDAAALPTTYDTQTQNRLYGGQIGAEALLWCGDRLTVDGLIKAGLFYNASGQNTTLDTGLVAATAAATADRAAFVGELGVTGSYCLTDCLSLRASYQLLWVETVALATDQIPATDFFTGGGIAADGGAFYHGALVGLEYRR